MISRKNKLVTTASLTLLLALGSSCAQESTKHVPAKQNQDLQDKPYEETNEASRHTSKQNNVAENDEKPANTKVSDTEDKAEMVKISQAFGNFIGRNLNSPGIKFDLESIIQGMRDGVAGKPSVMTDQEYEAAMTQLQLKAFKELTDENLKTANDFLAKNAKEANVKELVPGKLQYLDLQEGTGATVLEHNSPMIQYSGKFADGTVFGSSVDAGGPITIPLDQTVPGFSKGIVNMKEGGKRRLFVHPDLGYGTAGQLPPNSLLIFDIEVVKANAEQSKDDADSEPEFEILEVAE